MSKENLRKHTSIKNALPILERKESREDLRDQPTNDVEPRFAMTTQQSEVMKKIQNKLRMRKRSTNVNGNEKLVGTPPDMASTGNLSNNQFGEIQTQKGLQSYDMTIDIPETVDKLMDKDEKINERIVLSRVDRDAVKEHIIRDSTFILCQLNKGRRIEQIVLERIESVIESEKIKKRIEQKQKSILAMMDQRIRKLMMLQKAMVH